MEGTDSNLVYVFEGFRLDPGGRRLVSADGRTIALGSRVFDLLWYLAVRRGELVDKDMLLQVLWPDTVVEENSLNRVISDLRKALGELPGENRFILTEPGRGYRFVAEVQTFSREAAIIKPEDAPALRYKHIIPVLLSLLVVVVALGYFYLIQTRTSTTPKQSQAQTVINGAHPAKAPDKSVILEPHPLTSVAVLPFVNMSPDKNQDYFADGMAEEVLNQLTRIRDLFVIGRESSFSFKGKNEDLRIIGEKLGVSYLLEGSVRKEGNRVLVTTQLVKAEDGHNLWSRRYDRNLKDIFAIQEDIAKSVADTLQISLGVGELGRRSGMTRNVAAYDFYLQARAAYFNLPSDQGVPRAIELVQRAVALDPSFSQAWLDLSTIYYTGRLFLSGKAEDWLDKSDEALAHARQLTPDSPRVLIAEAQASQRQMHWRKADAFFSDKLPFLLKEHGDTNLGQRPTGVFLRDVGRIEDSIEILERAQSADPLNPTISSSLSIADMDNGNLKSALAESDRSIQHSKLSYISENALVVALATHDRREIEKYLAIAMSRNSGSSGRAYNVAMARFLDNPAAAPKEIRHMMSGMSTAENPVGFFVLAVWAGYYHDPELQLDLIQDIDTMTRAGLVPEVLWFPMFANVRKLPGFKDLVRRVGLVDYWRSTGNWGDFCHPVGEDDFECK